MKSIIGAGLHHSDEEDRHSRIQMSDHTQRFTGKAEAYDRYRQHYPAADVLRLLRSWCGLEHDWTVADVGAGTGMLAEVFLTNGNRVIAVEPNEEMRAACSRLQTKWPLLEVRDGTAETTGLEDASVEMIGCGRSFHWFDTAQALTEFRRVLKPAGWVVLVSAGRAKVDTVQAQAFERLLVEFGIDQTYARTTYRVHEHLEDLFVNLHQEQIHGVWELSWDMLRGFAASLSVVPGEGDARHDRFYTELRGYFETYAREGTLAMQTTCWISAGQPR